MIVGGQPASPRAMTRVAQSRLSVCLSVCLSACETCPVHGRFVAQVGKSVRPPLRSTLSWIMACTLGMRVEPPTSTTSCTLFLSMPESFKHFSTGPQKIWVYISSGRQPGPMGNVQRVDFLLPSRCLGGLPISRHTL